MSPNLQLLQAVVIQTASASKAATVLLKPVSQEKCIMRRRLHEFESNAGLYQQAQPSYPDQRQSCFSQRLHFGVVHMHIA